MINVFYDSYCVLNKVYSEKAFVKQAINSTFIEEKNRPKTTKIVYGVLDNDIRLSYYISRLCPKNPKLVVRTILKIAMYNIEFLGKSPYTVTDSSVTLCKKLGKGGMSGFVNAVLRRISREKDAPPQPDTGDIIEDISIRYSHPSWLVRRFFARLGREETEALLASNNTPPPVAARVNTLRASKEEAIRLLEAQQVGVEPHPFLPDALLLFHTGGIDRLDAYQNGSITIQDSASQLCALALAPQPGSRMLDLCAAPGGKSFACAAQMQNCGEIIACDLHPHRVKLISDGAQRLGIRILRPMQADGTVFRPDWEGLFDFVLVDAPCSGIGVIRRKSEIRYKTESSLFQLPPVQAALLSNAGRYVRPGGILVYSTCTLLQEENEAVFTAFLEKNGDFLPYDFNLPGVGASTGGMLTLWPQKTGTDGFFIAKARKSDAESARS